MHIKAIASTAVLAATLALGVPAFAQTMIGNQQVSQADMERVKNFCEDLKNRDADNVTAQTNEAAPDQKDETAEVGAVATDQITLENCIEAGFVEK